MHFSPERVELGFAVHTFYWEAAHDDDARALVGRLLDEQFGQKVKLTLTALDETAAAVAAPPSLAALHEQDGVRRQREIRAAAVAHPAVQQAISVLGGEITDVVPLADTDRQATTDHAAEVRK
jgi:hypothetical protein